MEKGPPAIIKHPKLSFLSARLASHRPPKVICYKAPRTSVWGQQSPCIWPNDQGSYRVYNTNHLGIGRGYRSVEKGENRFSQFLRGIVPLQGAPKAEKLFTLYFHVLLQNHFRRQRSCGQDRLDWTTERSTELSPARKQANLLGGPVNARGHTKPSNTSDWMHSCEKNPAHSACTGNPLGQRRRFVAFGMWEHDPGVWDQ